MPEISRLFGIIVTMYYNDHGLPHFHAKYRDHRAEVLIETGAIVGGALPHRAAALIEEWRAVHLAELLAVWRQIMAKQPHDKIDPLE